MAFNNHLRVLFILMLCMVTAVVPSCGSEADTDIPSTFERAVEKPEEEPVPVIRSYLTNEETSQDFRNKRPLALMFENTKDAWPHYGLADAGIIYEAPVEGGMTRYMGIFDDYENYERLGNARSARPYFIYLASELDPIYCNYGHSEKALSILKSGIVDNINGVFGGETYFRSDDKKAPHNAYLSSEGLKKEMASKGIDNTSPSQITSPFIFAEDENLLSGGSEATTIRPYYTNGKPYFVYDPALKTYTRYAFEQVEEDAYSPDGIMVSNIIFRDVDAWIEDDIGHVGMTLTGSGTGKFFTRGKMVDITWRKDSDTGLTHYYMQNGGEIELNTGKTFICLIENSEKHRNVIEPLPVVEEETVE